MCEQNNSNKGKDKELEVTSSLSTLGIGNPKFDVIRPSETNTPDSGADLIIKHTNNNLDEIINIANGKQYDFSGSLKDDSKEIKTRIDVKAYESRKIPKAVAQKFVGDIKLNPECDAHLLMGADGLTSGAKQVLDDARKQLSEGKRIEYINNEGVKRLNQIALEKAKKNLESSND